MHTSLFALTLSALVIACSNVPVAQASARIGGYALELVDEGGNRLPTYQSGDRTYVLGAQGRRYALHLHNNTGRRVEFVAAVDGRDVLDGEPSAWEKRGYIVNPYGDVVIDGFRLSSDSVAAFRFSSVQSSYAAKMGDARDVGVIGVAVFQERQRYYPPARSMRGYGHGYDDYRAQGRLADNAGPTGAAGEAGADKDAAPASPALGASPYGDESASAGAQAKKAERPGLGTQFGEQRESRVYETQFERASGEPAAILTVRYDDREGLVAMGVDLTPRYSHHYEAQQREAANPFRRDPGFSEPPPGWNAY